MPAYVIFPDRTLIEMATRRPQTLDALAGITGVGAVKLERFGPDLPRGPDRRARRRRSTPPAAASPASPTAALFDRLHAAQVALARGADGLGKPLNCTHATLAQIAEERPADLAALERIRAWARRRPSASARPSSPSSTRRTDLSRRAT